MNIELLKKLRNRFLRMRHAEHFQMDVIAVKTECGSVMCIAGHTLELSGYTRKLRLKTDRDFVSDYDFISPSGHRVKDPLPTAAKELGLNYGLEDDNIAYKLFHDYDLITPKQAAARIQELINAGESK